MQSPFCRDESRPDNSLLRFGAQGRTQTFNLWFVGPALRQLSYSGEMVVGVGIEPTFRAFQTRANPSQLSDRGRTMNFSRPPLLLVVHLLHDFAIIVHVHEQVLTPFGSRLCVVAEHDAFELHA